MQEGVAVNFINSDEKGYARERGLAKDVYFSDGYFSMPQLCTQAQQIHDIHSFGQKNILEVGLGNGFTSTFLRRAGYTVTTVDINPNLAPDVCCPMSDIPKELTGQKFGLAVCCEVLEHMPVDELESNIKILRACSDQLYLTLPNYSRSFGFGGLFRLPKLARNMSLFIDISIPKKLPTEHFWEVGSSKNTERSVVMRLLSKHYEQVVFKQFALNPYHLAFFCKSS